MGTAFLCRDRRADGLSDRHLLTAIYLEEYSPDNLLARFIEINIRNLAGVPSVVYGLLGLAVFVAFFAALGDGDGQTSYRGGLTSAVLILPLSSSPRRRPSGRSRTAPPRGRLRARRLALAGGPQASPAGRGAGHPDRDRACAVPGAGRDGAHSILIGAVLGSFSSGGSLA